jgi:hypothetical protein
MTRQKSMASAAQARAAGQLVETAAHAPQRVEEIIAVRAADRRDFAPDGLRRRGGDGLTGHLLAVVGEIRAILPIDHGPVGPPRIGGGAALDFQRRLGGRAIVLQLERNQRPDGRVARQDIVREAVDQRARDVSGHGSYQAQPVGRELRCQYRYRQYHRPAPHEVSELADELLVGQHFRTAHVVDRARGFWKIRNPGQVFEHVVERDGLRARAHPLRRDHRGQVEHEIADDLERGRPGPDDDSGAYFGDRYTAFAQYVAGFAARRQVS